MVYCHISTTSPTQPNLLTEDGKELTQVCIIDDYESGIVIYDKLVRPPKPLIDYLTKYRFHQPSRWSRITKASLAVATTTLAKVQTQLLAILAPQGGLNLHPRVIPLNPTSKPPLHRHRTRLPPPPRSTS
jgi:hypothetical protein